MAGLLERLAAGEALVGDGATGTYLQGKGLGIGEPPEIWNLSHPDVVQGMAADYFGAGSDLVETNSFGANRFRIRHAGLEDRVAEVNQTAARLARASAPENGLVVGSMGPSGEMLVPLGEATPGGLSEAFAEQAAALAEGGVDGFCVETMTALDEAVLAVRAAKEGTGLPVMATMTFDRGPKGFATSMGVRIDQAVDGLLEAGADVVGTNCGCGVAQMADIVGEMGAHTEAPILVQPNAGLPELRDGVPYYPESPEEMAARYAEMVRAGARVLGGCCGTGPAHITAIVEAVKGA
ncbi:MAG: homocysteine S-methyltransferase family protein [Candidatus Latescibacteria bacterium]|nr:homocysteine S-methyltransferase family protein [Candidatus Latescibacterota bacterium]